MTSHYLFPKNAYFGKTLPKSKIYDRAKPSSKVRECFVSQVDKIIWGYKLSPKTINLPAARGVEEIQVFTISLKTDRIDDAVLQTIDKVVPSPIFYQINSGTKVCYAISYKRASEADKLKWVISDYFYSDWLSQDSPTQALPVCLNMSVLYEYFVTKLMPLQQRKGESLEQCIERVQLYRKTEKEVARLEGKINNEKQFNRQVEMNRQLQKKRRELADLGRKE